MCQSQTFYARQKDDLHSAQFFFCAGTKVFEEALNPVKFLGWLKKFGPTQNIFGPVKGQFLQFCSIHKYTCQITIPSILLVNSEFLIIFLAFSQYLNFSGLDLVY